MVTSVISAATVTLAGLVFPAGTGHLAGKRRHLLGLIQACIVSDQVDVPFYLLGAHRSHDFAGCWVRAVNENHCVSNLFQEKQSHGMGLFFFHFHSKGHSTEQNLSDSELAIFTSCVVHRSMVIFLCWVILILAIRIKY